jgi:hypothetical protein
VHNMAKLDAPVPQNATVHYSIDNAASKFTVQAFAGGILSAVGHNPIFEISDFSGEGTIADDWEQASIEIIISSASLKVVSEMSAKDRAEEDRRRALLGRIQRRLDLARSDSRTYGLRACGFRKR